MDDTAIKAHQVSLWLCIVSSFGWAPGNLNSKLMCNLTKNLLDCFPKNYTVLHSYMMPEGSSFSTP